MLLLLDRRYRFKPPALFALYVSIYTFGRFFEELIRVDPAHHFAGLRLNAWVSIVVFVALDRVLRLVAVLPRRRGRAAAARPAARARARGPGDGDPQGPRPALTLGCARRG